MHIKWFVIFKGLRAVFSLQTSRYACARETPGETSQIKNIGKVLWAIPGLLYLQLNPLPRYVMASKTWWSGKYSI